VGAAQILTYAGTEVAALLLRLKVRLGDPEEEVISECFTGILEITKEAGVPFVAESLDSGSQAIQEAALLALGSSRQAAAFGILKSFAEKCIGEIQETAHVALALLRLPAAIDLLLSLVADPSPTVAENALKALAVHGYDPRVRERTAAAVAQNGTSVLRELFAKRFGEKE
jgi:HEAT repeat protein